ncbi:MAG: hypothetical protein JXA00_05350 [Candidatus Thermoplasmatota archaeon]|nr:hypothetical protein [Candidatus Thermoplasmatota archaeon]
MSLSPNTIPQRCVGCGDTAFSTVSSSGRILQRFSRQLYDIAVILVVISGLFVSWIKQGP